MIRQPIVVVLGHVDHGKTTLLDRIRGTTVAEKEPGKITQHIGATEVPKYTIERIGKDLLKKFGFELKIPGLLFIDTPGHEAFANLRTRGGSIADIAVLVVDINQGVQPQTKESIEILKSYKVPFVVAATKIDILPEWNSQKGSFLANLANQSEEAKRILDEKLYELVGQLYNEGFQSERFDRCKDFKKELAIIPVSGATGEGIPELLIMLAGLSQKFMKKKLEIDPNEKAKGVILEVREEKGFGTTIDVVLYTGKLRVNDEIIIGGKKGVIRTKIRALLKPKPLNEIRDKKSAFVHVKEVTAACGVKIAAPKLEDALPGAPLTAALEETTNITKEVASIIQQASGGLVVKANTLGTLEAIVKLLKNKGINVAIADIGDITRKDVMEAYATKEKNILEGVVLGFCVGIDEYASEEAKKLEVPIFRDDVIYNLLENYFRWRTEEEERMKREKEQKLTWPAKLAVLPQYVFRNKEPAIFGVKVLAGKIKPNDMLLNPRGKIVGKILGIQSEGKELHQASEGMEVAISVDKGVIGRNIKLNDVLYTYISKKNLIELQEIELSDAELQTLEEIKNILKNLQEGESQ